MGEGSESVADVVKDRFLNKNYQDVDFDVVIIPDKRYDELCILNGLEAALDDLANRNAGLYLFVEDIRKLTSVTDKPGIYLHTKTLRDSVLVLRLLSDKYPLRHVLFDYYLGDQDSLDVMFELTIGPRVKTSDNLTFSIHSNSEEGAAKLRKYGLPHIKEDTSFVTYSQI